MTSPKSVQIDPRATLAAAAVPFMVYVWTASGYAHWFDAGEFVAVASDLGISHPPGHPLAGLVLGLANLLPIGPLAFRVALVCGVLVAVASAALFRAAVITLTATGLESPRLHVPLALAASWWTAGCYAWWFQAVRPEVYALQAALLCVALERLLTQEIRWPTRHLAPLHQAALCMGLALANHHFLAILLFPAALPLSVRIVRTLGFRPLLRSILYLLGGLAAYLYLPLRAASHPYLNFGEPTSPQRLLWVVSAEAFQKSLTTEYQPLWERLGDVGIALVESLHMSVVLAGLVGLYFMLRVPTSRRVAWVWLNVLFIYIFGRAWLGFVRSNPDALGYLMLAFGGVSVCAASAVAILITVLKQQRHPAERLAPFVVLCLAIAALGQFPRTMSRASLASFTDTDVFDDGLRRDLPDNAVVFAHNPQTLFRFWGGEAESQSRPDLIMVALPFLTYPGMVERILDRAPELKPVLTNYLLRGDLRAQELQGLAAEHPVFVEMDVRVSPALYATIIPDGLFYEVLADGATATDVRQGARKHAASWQRLYSTLGPPIDRETRALLLWHHYMDALYFAGVGARTEARTAVSQGIAINPKARELVARSEALAAPGTGPIDVRPYLPR